MQSLTAAMRAALGHLQLRIRRGPAFLGTDGEPTGYRDVYPPGAVVGRGEEADLQVLDEDDYVSRRHVVVESTGLQWYVRDLGSSHGTSVLVCGRTIALPRGGTMPIGAGDTVVLARTSAFEVTVISSPRSGRRTRDAPPAGTGRLDDPLLFALVYELLRLRRENATSHRGLTTAQLADCLGLGQRAVQLRLKKLAQIDQISQRLPENPNLHDYAVASAAVYPYLA